MSTRSVRLPDVESQADEWEATLKAARVPDELASGWWDLWAVSPGRALATLRYYVAGRDQLPAAVNAKVQVKLKAADVIDQAIERLRQAATAMAQRVGDQQIAAYVNTMADQLVASSGAAGTATDMTAQKQAKRQRSSLNDDVVAMAFGGKNQ